MDILEASAGLISFMEADTDEVFDHLLQQASSLGLRTWSKDYFPRYLYIEGQRPDKVLIVAHSDTVWGDDERISVRQQNGILYSASVEDRKLIGGEFPSDAIGIGADDRVGCWMLSQLIRTGHSILLNDFEEVSLGPAINARDTELGDLIVSCKLAVELDRGHSNDLVFYNGESDKFKNYIKTSFPGYTEAQGSSSDIKYLCKKRIPAFNISVGYWNAHSPNEYVVVSEVLHTLKMMEIFLKKEQSSWTI